MATVDANAAMKVAVRNHWETETCGTRYAEAEDRVAYFDQISRARYDLEPYIMPFAAFPDAAGKKMLEIGVGAGSDFENWCRRADQATGVDLTEAAITLTDERLRLRGIPSERYTLQVADAENLPFDDGVFDLVYSWGVLHHTPDTVRAFAEAYRVLKPGGSLKAMIYHVPSWVGLLLAAKQVVKARTLRVSMKGAIFDDLESPGTKAYTVSEAHQLLAEVGFVDADVSTKLSIGDLLTIRLGGKFRSPGYLVMQRLYPRWLVRRLGDRFGLMLLIEATKPANAATSMLQHSVT